MILSRCVSFFVSFYASSSACVKCFSLSVIRREHFGADLSKVHNFFGICVNGDGPRHGAGCSVLRAAALVRSLAGIVFFLHQVVSWKKFELLRLIFMLLSIRDFQGDLLKFFFVIFLENFWFFLSVAEKIRIFLKNHKKNLNFKFSSMQLHKTRSFQESSWFLPVCSLLKISWIFQENF